MPELIEVKTLKDAERLLAEGTMDSEDFAEFIDALYGVTSGYRGFYPNKTETAKVEFSNECHSPEDGRFCEVPGHPKAPNPQKLDRWKADTPAQEKALQKLKDIPTLGKQDVDGEIVKDAIPGSAPFDPSIRKDFTEAEVEELPKHEETIETDSIIATKNKLKRSAIAAVIHALDQPDGPWFRPGYLPIVIKKNGKNYLWDGHHRIEGARILGQKTTKVQVIQASALEFSNDCHDPETGQFCETPTPHSSSLLGDLTALSSNNRTAVHELIKRVPKDIQDILIRKGISIKAYPKVLRSTKGTIDYGGQYVAEKKEVQISDSGFADLDIHEKQGNAHFLLHELGHAVDHALGYPSKLQEFRSIWKDAEPKKDSYFQKSFGGSDPRQELLAEAYAHAWSGTKSPEFKTTPYLEQVINELRHNVQTGVAASAVRVFSNDCHDPGTGQFCEKPHSVVQGQMPRKEVGTAVKRTFDLIDQVHSVPAGVPKLPVRANRSMKAQAAYEYYDTPEGEKPKQITVNPRVSTHLELSFAHEFGHYLDSQVFKRGRIPSPEQSPEAEVLHNAIKSSYAMDTLHVIADSNVNSTRVKARARYYLTRSESFARAYAQYVAMKTQDPELVSQVNGVLSYNKKVNNVYPYSQWETKDFEPIYHAFDKLFASKGLLKPGKGYYK